NPLAPGQGGSVTIQVQINQNAANGTQLINQAIIRLANSNQALASSSAATMVTSAAPPTLTLQKAVDKTSANPGETLTYSLAYQNTGQQTASNVVIVDQLPNGVTFQGSPSSPQLVNNGQAVQFTIATVGPGASGSVSFTVQIQGNVTNGTQISNTA